VTQFSDGASRRKRAQGRKADKLHGTLEAIDRQLADWGDTFVFGQVWARPGLSHDDRMLVAIVALAAAGHEPQLQVYLHGALQEGIPASRIHESLVMLVVYVGWPATLKALVVWQKVVQSARRRGTFIDIEYPL
jgi:4-carboxymuconolactone decarboxylase